MLGKGFNGCIRIYVLSRAAILSEWLMGDKFAILLNQPLRFVGLIIAAGITGFLGWWLGEITLSQLKRMGYWKTDT